MHFKNIVTIFARGMLHGFFACRAKNDAFVPFLMHKSLKNGG